MKVYTHFPPDYLENSYHNIRTIDDYYLLNSIYSAPVFAWGSHIEYRYVDQFKLSEDGICLELKFKQSFLSAKGVAYSGDVWVESINSMFDSSLGVHFNPRESLAKKVEWDENTNIARVYFKEPQSKPFDLLGRPEAALVISDKIEYGFDGFGPYYVKEVTDDSLLLVSNPNFPIKYSNAPDEIILFKNHKDLSEVNLVLSPLDKTDLSGKFIRKSVFTMTYFLRVSETSEVFKSQNARNQLATESRLSFEVGSEFSGANHMIPPGEGLGRVVSSPLISQESVKCISKPISLATVKTPKLQILAEHLKSIFQFQLEISFFDSYGELFDGDYIKFDLLLINNDFCGMDPHGALYNAFNIDRPLFSRGDSYTEELFRSIDKRLPDEERNRLYQKLHKRLLDAQYNIPVAYSSLDLYHDSTLDLSDQIPLSFWTIKLRR